MSLIRRDRRQWTAEPFVPPFPGVDYGGSVAVSALTAMQSSAVWACVRLLASTVSMMPLQSFTLRNGVRMPADPVSLFMQPSARASITDWLYMLMSSLLLRGNAYGRVVARDVNQYPTQIELANPDDVSVTFAGGVLTYRFGGVEVPARDVFHVRAYRLPGYELGLSPIQYGAVTINRDRAIQQFSLGYFRDAPNPSSVLTSDQPVNQDSARTIKDRVKAAVTGRDILVLGNGLKFQPLSVSPEESQFLQTQKYGASEICRFFGVPPSKVAAAEIGSSLLYSTVEGNSLDLLIYTVQWWLSCLEAAFFPLMPGQRHVRFDPSVLLRTDLETRMKSTAIGIASKQLTPDEARAMGDLPPLTDDQKAILALVPMDVGPTGTPKLLPGAAQTAATVSTEENP